MSSNLDRTGNADAKIKTVYTMGDQTGRSYSDKVFAAQAIQEEFGCNSRSRLEAFRKKLREGKPQEPGVCALCDRPSEKLTHLNPSESSPLVCDDCGVDYWMSVTFVHPPALMKRTNKRR